MPTAPPLPSFGELAGMLGRFLVTSTGIAVTSFLVPILLMKNDGGSPTGDLADILKDAVPDGMSKPGKGSDKYAKPGGSAEANDDFDNYTQGRPVKDYGDGTRSAKFPDGTTISVRPDSSGANGAPTIQINPPNGNPIKIRYR
jgi:hypothetical protein